MSTPVYISFMPPKTKGIFGTLCTQNFISEYTLVGGTALAIQIRHRQSEDIDFVYDDDTLNSKTIKKNVAKLFPDYRIIRQDNNEQIDLIIHEAKVTFFASGSIALPFTVKEHAFKYKKMNICRAKTIASLKMAAIAQRNTMRDYYDLYCLSRYHFSFPAKSAPLLRYL